MKTVEQIMELATILGDRRLLATRGMNSRDDVANAHEALRTAIEELHRDAERYQWLKSNAYIGIAPHPKPHEVWCLRLPNPHICTSLNTAIDAAMEST